MQATSLLHVILHPVARHVVGKVRLTVDLHSGQLRRYFSSNNRIGSFSTITLLAEGHFGDLEEEAAAELSSLVKDEIALSSQLPAASSSVKSIAAGRFAALRRRECVDRLSPRCRFQSISALPNFLASAPAVGFHFPLLLSLLLVT